MKEKIVKNMIKRIIAVVVAVAVVFPLNSFAIQSNAEDQFNEEEYKELLLYGYDVTGGKNLSDINALKKQNPIIDINSGYLDNVKVFSANTSGQESFSGAGSSYREVANEFAISQAAGIFGQIYMVDADLEESFDFARRITDVYSERYEVYSMLIYKKEIVLQSVKPGEIKNYLSKNFKEDLYKVNSKSDAKELFDMYGTHLNTGYILGGRMDIYNYMCTSERGNTFEQSGSLSSKVSAVVGDIKGGLSASISENYENVENDATSQSNYTMRNYGGDGIASLRIEDLLTYNAAYGNGNASYIYSPWVDSINEGKNLAIISVSDNATMPIWDLLDNSTEAFRIRQFLMDAYIERCGDKYDEFMSKYPAFSRSIQEDDGEQGLPEFDGLYIRTPNEYFYHVDSSDIEANGNHYELHKDDRLYLELSNYNPEDVEFEVQNCSIVDEKNLLFKVTGNNGNVVVKAKTKNNEYDRILINTPIKSIDFECGAGTEEYPYVITNTDQFLKISAHTNDCFILYSDLDFAGKDISCLGVFDGQLDGNYCTIENFKIKQNDRWGLFADNRGKIKNLSIKKAGTSLTDNDFSSGGCDYSNDYSGENYSKNSVSAYSAGIICGDNNGEIINCCVSNCFIRNIVKNDVRNSKDSEIIISVGGITGINQGKIDSCMVSDSRILASYFYDEEKNKEYSERILAGGIAGMLIGDGQVIDSVSDISGKGTIMSQAVNKYKLSANVSLSVFSAGLIGYSQSGSIKNSHVFVRNCPESSKYRAIDAEYTFLKSKPDNYWALRGVLTVTDKDNESVIYESDSVCSKDSQLNVLVILPNKNGNNREKDKKSYSELAESNVRIQDITDEGSFNNLKLKKSSFIYNKNSACCIMHGLLRNRSEYMSVSRDINTALSSFILGEKFVPEGLRVKRSIEGAESDEELVYFNLALKGEANIDKELSTDKNKLIISIYENIKSDEIKLSVDSNAIKEIYIDGEYEIYSDEIDDYISSWEVDSIQLMGKMSNNEIVSILDSESGYAAKTQAELRIKNDDIELGDNLITVFCKVNGKAFNPTYILHVKKRDVESIEIVEKPKKLDYHVGDSVNLDGLVIKVNYSEGGDSTYEYSNIKNHLELIGKTVVKGENTVTVTYDGYSNTADFVVTGEERQYSEESETSEIITDESENVDDTTEDTIDDKKAGNKVKAWMIVVPISVTLVMGTTAFVIIRKRKSSKNSKDKE